MTRFEKWSVWSTSLLAAGTGVALFAVKYLMEAGDPWAVVNHPIQPWLLKAHILTVPLLVFAVGLITLKHVWRHFVTRVACARKSGSLTALVTAPMIVSGYLIQAVTHTVWLQIVALAHIALGLLFVVGLAVHQVVIRRGANGNARQRADRDASDRSPRRPLAARGAGRRPEEEPW